MPPSFFYANYMGEPEHLRTFFLGVRVSFHRVITIYRSWFRTTLPTSSLLVIYHINMTRIFSVILLVLAMVFVVQSLQQQRGQFRVNTALFNKTPLVANGKRMEFEPGSNLFAVWFQNPDACISSASSDSPLFSLSLIVCCVLPAGMHKARNENSYWL